MSDKLPGAPRKDWLAKMLRLADVQSDDLSSSTTPLERFEMVQILSARMWELTGDAPPMYARATVPVRVVRKR